MDDTERLLIGPDLPGTQELGRLIERWRRIQHLTAAEVAERAQVSDVYERMVERGMRSPSEATAAQLLAAVGLQVRRLPGPSQGTGSADLEVVSPDGERVHLEFRRNRAARRRESSEPARMWAMLSSGDPHPGAESPTPASPDLARRWALLGEIVQTLATMPEDRLEAFRILLAMGDSTEDRGSGG